VLFVTVVFITILLQSNAGHFLDSSMTVTNYGIRQ